MSAADSLTTRPIRRTSAPRGVFDFDRVPRDLRERQLTLGVTYSGTLLHETWMRTQDGTTHDSVNAAVHAELKFAGDTVVTRDDIARALRALADAIEKTPSDTEITTPE
jgi:hypothetical protein